MHVAGWNEMETIPRVKPVIMASLVKLYNIKTLRLFNTTDLST